MNFRPFKFFGRSFAKSRNPFFIFFRKEIRNTIVARWFGFKFLKLCFKVFNFSQIEIFFCDENLCLNFTGFFDPLPKIVGLVDNLFANFTVLFKLINRIISVVKFDRQFAVIKFTNCHLRLNLKKVFQRNTAFPFIGFIRRQIFQFKCSFAKFDAFPCMLIDDTVKRNKKPFIFWILNISVQTTTTTNLVSRIKVFYHSFDASVPIFPHFGVFFFGLFS